MPSFLSFLPIFGECFFYFYKNAYPRIVHGFFYAVAQRFGVSDCNFILFPQIFYRKYEQKKLGRVVSFAVVKEYLLIKLISRDLY